jgi:hypothetical protein
MRYLLTLTICLFAGLSLAEEKLDPTLLPVETELLKQINVERARFGLPAIIMHPRLQIQARRHAAWMANNQSMVHSADPQPENISIRSSLPEAVRGWMNSSGHRANILNASYVTTGAAGLLGCGQDPMKANDEEIAKQVGVDVLGTPTHVILLEATDSLADGGFDLSLGSHGNRL